MSERRDLSASLPVLVGPWGGAGATALPCSPLPDGAGPESPGRGHASLASLPGGRALLCLHGSLWEHPGWVALRG